MYKIIRVLLAEKNSLVGVGIRATLNLEEDLILVGETNDVSKLAKLNLKFQPDLLIIDLDLTNFILAKLIADLHELCSYSRVLTLASSDKFDLSILKINGIKGCVFKSEEPQTLVSAIRAVAQGNTWYSQTIIEKLIQQQIGKQDENVEATLTEREQQVIGLIAQGWDNARISVELSLAQQTVRNYMSRIYTKLAVNSRSEAVIWAIKHSLGKQHEKVQI
ncbi:response regulator transcription factor [Nostocaceae cyanobacterium CENA357]|uniref:Response regulator transcription factor n=1 Tax=Atlanticothrix silvestris CENA357 TaxID=1725252 RepID=A0A8J7HAD7_9CYAN|nr:response regulator transcription factor [Atlanticothrix silvestris]MBH8552316.1 response regulator transcription factor [Atlanticothrix silvestris CENA357]